MDTPNVLPGQRGPRCKKRPLHSKFDMGPDTAPVQVEDRRRQGAQHHAPCLEDVPALLPLEEVPGTHNLLGEEGPVRALDEPLKLELPGHSFTVGPPDREVHVWRPRGLEHVLKALQLGQGRL